MKIGKRIYYDNQTGEVIFDTGERSGNVVPTTVERDIEVFKQLSERNRDTFDYIELEYGQYREDFHHATSYLVNPKTRELVFSYDKIDEEEEETEPIYQEPLTEKVERLEKEKENLEKTVSALGQAVAHEKVMGVQKDMLLQEIGKEVTALKVQLITSKGGE